MAARAELDTTLRAAMATPDYPGERELFEHEVQPRITALDAAIAGLQATLAEKPQDGAHGSAAVSTRPGSVQ